MRAKKPKIKEEDLVKRYQDLLEITRFVSGCMRDRQIAAKVRRYFRENRDKKGEKHISLLLNANEYILKDQNQKSCKEPLRLTVYARKNSKRLLCGLFLWLNQGRFGG